MKNLLKELQKTKIVKITGSYADGSQNEFSDIDFYVKDENIDTPREKRNIVKIIKILDNYNIRWQSSAPETISTIGCKNNIDKELEFSSIFRKRKNKLKEVIIEEVKFKTY